MAKHGGKRPGAGRKKKDEVAIRDIILRGVKQNFGVDKDEDAENAIIARLLESDSGTKWVAEKLWGKPVDNLDITSNGESVRQFDINVIMHDERTDTDE
jgi:hypothetical protein